MSDPITPENPPALPRHRGRPRGKSTFPLTLHKNGQYCKRIRNKVRYFGTDKRQALERYRREALALHSGDSKASSNGRRKQYTIGDICNIYLDYQEEQATAGEIEWRTYRDALLLLEPFKNFVGENTPVDEVDTMRLQEYRSRLIRQRLAPDTINNRLGAMRAVYRHALLNRVLDQTPNTLAVKPMTRKEAHHQVYDREQIQKLLDHAGVQMRAMILLGVNCALGCTDCAKLEWRHLDLENARIDYPRPKTAVERYLRLWRSTVQALRAVPRRTDLGPLVFYTKYGRPWIHTLPNGNQDDAISKEFKKLCRKAGVPSPKGDAFYALRRTTATVAAETGDAFAVKDILGHKDLKMATRYVQKVKRKITPNAHRALDYLENWFEVGSAGEMIAAGDDQAVRNPPSASHGHVRGHRAGAVAPGEKLVQAGAADPVVGVPTPPAGGCHVDGEQIAAADQIIDRTDG
jgi:integrase